MCEIGKKISENHKKIERSEREWRRFSKNESDHVKWYELVLIMWIRERTESKEKTKSKSEERLLSQLIDKSVYEEE